MPNYKVLISPIQTSEGDKEVGDIITMTEQQASPLVELGAVELIKAAANVDKKAPA